MNGPTEYEKQVEGAGTFLNSDQTQYFQLFAVIDDGSITLAGQRPDASFDASQFLGQQIQCIADRTGMSYQEAAELGVQEAQTSTRSQSTMNSHRRPTLGALQ